MTTILDSTGLDFGVKIIPHLLAVCLLTGLRRLIILWVSILRLIAGQVVQLWLDSSPASPTQQGVSLHEPHIPSARTVPLRLCTLTADIGENPGPIAHKSLQSRWGPFLPELQLG